MRFQQVGFALILHLHSFLTSIQYGMNEQSENVAIAPFFKHAVEKLDVYDLEEMEPDDLKSNFQF